MTAEDKTCNYPHESCAGCSWYASCESDRRDEYPYTCAGCGSDLKPNWVVAEDEHGQPLCDICNYGRSDEEDEMD